MKSVILAVPSFYPDGVGGAERQALILSEALARLGVDVTVVAPTVWPEAPERERTSFGHIERLRLKAYPNFGGRRIGSFLAWTYWFWRRYGTAAYRDIPIYIFHARLHALGPALAARRSGAPLLVKMGGGGQASDFEALRAKRFFYGQWVEALLLRWTDCFVANGGQIVEDLRALGIPDSRIAAFPNGVVLPPEKGVLDALDARSGNSFLFSGRLVPDKRVSVLFEATRLLASQSPAPRLTLLGEGPERERLSLLANSFSQSDLFEFPGYVDDVYPALTKADFFVSASQREGQSNALLEAMALGLIPIVYRASGVADVVEHGRTGFLVDQSTPPAFAEAMKDAMEMSASRRREMAMAARNFVAANIGIDTVAQQTLQTLSRLTEEKQNPARWPGRHGAPK